MRKEEVEEEKEVEGATERRVSAFRVAGERFWRTSTSLTREPFSAPRLSSCEANLHESDDLVKVEEETGALDPLTTPETAALRAASPPPDWTRRVGNCSSFNEAQVSVMSRTYFSIAPALTLISRAFSFALVKSKELKAETNNG